MLAVAKAESGFDPWVVAVNGASPKAYHPGSPAAAEALAKALLARIAADPRHHSLVSLYRREIAQRLFPDWSMALTRVDSVDPEQRAFCKGLRDVELNSTDEHRQFVEPFLASFRAWIR